MPCSLIPFTGAVGPVDGYRTGNKVRWAGQKQGVCRVETKSLYHRRELQTYMLDSVTNDACEIVVLTKFLNPLAAKCILDPD